jgi:galactose-1-phosphate uridylyltransferase
MNPLSLLHLQNKSFDSKVNQQAQDIFEKISRAILQEKNYILYENYIYPVNRCILNMKGYYVENSKIVWDNYLTLE